MVENNTNKQKWYYFTTLLQQGPGKIASDVSYDSQVLRGHTLSSKKCLSLKENIK